MNEYRCDECHLGPCFEYSRNKPFICTKKLNQIPKFKYIEGRDNNGK